MPTTVRISDLTSHLRKSIAQFLPATALNFFLHVAPVPASRPRVSRYGTYYSKPYEMFRKTAQPLADAFDGIPTDKPVIVVIETIAVKPKTGKLLMPRGDADNYAKGPMDIMTKAKKFWADDNQVGALLVVKRYAEPHEQPGYRIDWWPVDIS